MVVPRQKSISGIENLAGNFQLELCELTLAIALFGLNRQGCQTARTSYVVVNYRVLAITFAKST